MISNSSANKVHDNNIINAKNPLRIDPGLDQVNTLYANRIENSSTPNNNSPPPDTSSSPTDTSPPDPSPPDTSSSPTDTSPPG